MDGALKFLRHEGAISKIDSHHDVVHLLGRDLEKKYQPDGVTPWIVPCLWRRLILRFLHHLASRGAEELGTSGE